MTIPTFEYLEAYIWKNQFHLLLLSRDTAKILQTFFFRALWARLAILANIDNINLQKGLFICMQKVNFMPPFFFEILQIYWKDLLFRVLWACLIMTTKNSGIYFKETLILIFMQKSKFMSYRFLPNILLWVLWACLASHTKTIVSSCKLTPITLLS